MRRVLPISLALAGVLLCACGGRDGEPRVPFERRPQPVDLVLLGAIPTVVLAFSAAVFLDALTDLTRRVPR